MHLLQPIISRAYKYFQTLPDRKFSTFDSSNVGIIPNLNIFVCQHDNVQLPSCFSDRRIYRPILCGAYSNEQKQEFDLADDVGDNLSRYNTYLNEHTGIYWVAKHYTDIGNPEFVGFAHYRRSLRWLPKYLKGDTVMASALLYRRPHICGLPNYPELLQVIERAKLFFQDSEFDDIDQYLHQRLLYTNNIFIMSRENFFRYFSFIEKCLTFVLPLIDNNTIDLTNKDAYHKRLYSFFLEGMSSYWIWHNAKQKHIKLVRSTIDYYDIPNLVTSLY